MTERKPPGMPWESWIDQQIREAREDEAQVRARVETLNREISTVNVKVAEGPDTRLGLLDVEAILQRWREQSPHTA